MDHLALAGIAMPVYPYLLFLFTAGVQKIWRF